MEFQVFFNCLALVSSHLFFVIFVFYVFRFLTVAGVLCSFWEFNVSCINWLDLFYFSHTWFKQRAFSIHHRAICFRIVSILLLISSSYILWLNLENVPNASEMIDSRVAIMQGTCPGLRLYGNIHTQSDAVAMRVTI